jgi:hypothetical protein
MKNQNNGLFAVLVLLYNLDFILAAIADAAGNSNVKILKSETMTTKYGGFPV